MDKALGEIALLLGHCACRLDDIPNGCADAELQFAIRKHSIAITNIAINIETLAGCARHNTPADGVRMMTVNIGPFA